jgi:membrane associated rhomboid family serine protease
MYITYSILAITIIISLLAINDVHLKSKLLLNPYDVVEERNWYRMLTHGFVHADFLHLFFNMYVLYIFGVGVEAVFMQLFETRGYMMYPLFYIAAILFAGLPALVKHRENPSYNSLGASGAVMAVLFVFILFFPMQKLYFLFIPIGIPAYIMGPIILILEYVLAKRGGTNIAHDAHIAGAIFGIIFMVIAKPEVFIHFINQFGQ